MADNTDEVPLENPIKNQSENAPDEIISRTVDKETTTQFKKPKIWKYIIMPTILPYLIIRKIGNHISGNF